MHPKRLCRGGEDHDFGAVDRTVLITRSVYEDRYYVDLHVVSDRAISEQSNDGTEHRPCMPECHTDDKINLNKIVSSPRHLESRPFAIFRFSEKARADARPMLSQRFLMGMANEIGG